jgi:hypothetical protein
MSGDAEAVGSVLGAAVLSAGVVAGFFGRRPRLRGVVVPVLEFCVIVVEELEF